MKFNLICILYGIKNVFLTLAIIWRISAEKNIHDNSNCSNITLFVITRFLKNLWSYIVSRSKLFCHESAWCEYSCSSPVNYFDIVICHIRITRFKKYVLTLDISMYNMLLMSINQSSKQLSDAFHCLILSYLCRF